MFVQGLRRQVILEPCDFRILSIAVFGFLNDLVGEMNVDVFYEPANALWVWLEYSRRLRSINQSLQDLQEAYPRV
jgi:hypothetical protein